MTRTKVDSDQTRCCRTGKTPGADQALIRGDKLSVETNRLLHELQVHHVELEMQNNELSLSRQELEASRKRYFDLFDMAPVGYLTLTKQGDVLEANLTVASLLGVARSALLTTSLSTYISPEDLDLFYQQHQQLAESLVPQQWEMRMIRPDGTLFWADVKATPTRNDECWIVLEDISRRKQAEDLLHYQSRQMIQLILDNVPQRIFWKDRNSVYLGCNQYFVEDSGLADSKQVIGKTDFDLSWHERAEHYRKDDQLVMKADRPKLHYEESIKCADGTYLCITSSKVPLHDPNGNVIGVLCTYENITERKQALEELSKNAEQYRAMLATNLFGYWLVDLTGSILEVNDTYCRMSGYTREELLQYSISDIESSESEEDILQHIEQLVICGTGQFESKHRSKNGRIYDVEISTTYLSSQSKFIVFIRDISDRKQAEVALQESEARYHAIVEDQTDFICCYRPDGRLSFVNEAYLRCFKKKRNELINRNYIPHIPEPDLSRIMEQLKGISPERPIVNVEHKVIMPDGVICWQHWVHRGIYSADDIIVEYQAVGRDITKRKRAEDELLESREKLKVYMDNSFDVIFVLDAEGVFQFVSRAWERHFGIPINDVLWRNFALFVHPDDIPPCAEHLASILNDGQSMTSPPYRVKRSDGSWRWFIANGSRYVDTRNEWQYIGVAHDISDQYEAEEKLRQAKAAAESANQAKSAFLATMSHEIRTPLSALLGNIDLLATSQLAPQQQEYLKDCQAASQMLLQVINDVLDFSKIEAGKLEVANEIFSVSSMARQLVRIFTVAAAQKGLVLTLSLADDLPVHISSDQHRLRQIISNLLSNAIKFTSHGTVSLDIASELSSSARGSNNVVLSISIRDTGSGIPQDKQATIFDSFTQVENFSTRRHTGTGLGLAISRRLAEIMGGDISLSSEPGEGSVFTLTLPVVVANAPTQHAIAAHRTRAKTNTPWNILLADDEELGRTVTKALLQRHGHSVTGVANGAELLEALRGERFDIVLSDISMPDMDGLEVAQIIRSGKLAAVDPQIPIIAMTAHAFKNEVENYLTSGFNGYASKPVNFEELLITIDELCICHSRQ